MAFLKLLLSIDMIISAMVFPAANWIADNEIQTTVDHSSNNHLSNNIKPIHYNIEFILPIEEDTYQGDSIIIIEIYEKIRNIKMHLVNLVVTKTILINEDLRKSKKDIKNSIYKPISYSYFHDTNIFTMHFGDTILPGNYTLHIKFLGKATNETEGLFRTSYKNKKGNTRWLFATYLQTTGARRLFPCWDEPKFKTTFTICVKHSQKYTALSNMPIREKTYNVENNMMWTHFYTTFPMSPHLVAIAIISYESDVSITKDIAQISVFQKLNIEIWFKESEKYESSVYKLFQSFILYLEDYWNMLSLKIMPKVDYIAIPNFPEKAVATWGLVFYREADIFDEPNNVISHKYMESLITRNIIEEALSNVPSWLKEGFANFVDVDIIDKFYKTTTRMNLLVVQNQHESLRLNFNFNRNYSKNNKSLDINSLPSFIRYNKAFSILRMLQHLITDEVFRFGTRRYLKNVPTTILLSSKLFWISMQEVLDISDFKNENNLIEKMDGWTKLKNYPILKVTRDYGGYINILLENFVSTDSDLWIPITYTTQNNPDFNKTSLRDVVWLQSTKKLLSIDVSRNFKVDGWIIINLQQTGFYRVNYDIENWNKIAEYLNSAEYTKIHILNRAQIIDDTYHFLMTKQIDSSVFWKITNYLSQETKFIAWYPMIKVFEWMSSVFPLPDRRVYNIKDKMQKILNKLLQNITYEDTNEPNFLNCLRQEAAKWACIFDESNCKTVAAFKLQQHLANRTTNKLLPWWEEWTYCNGLAMSGNNIWNDVFNIYMNKSDNKYLKFLACSENMAIIRKYMMIMALGNHKGIIKDKDHINSFHFIIAKHAKNNMMLDYILASFEKITPRQTTAAILIDIINHVYSKEQLDKIRQFTKDYSNELILNVKRKIEIRLFEIKNQVNYLQLLTNKNQ